MAGSTPSPTAVAKKADDRDAKEMQSVIKKASSASATRIRRTHQFEYTTQRIGDDPEEMARIKREQELAAQRGAGSGGGISEEDPTIVTEDFDEDGVYNVYDEKKEPEFDEKGKRIPIPDVLLYQDNGCLTLSVPGHKFEQKHAKMIIDHWLAKKLKAEQSGDENKKVKYKELVLQIGSPSDRQIDWSERGKRAALKSLENLDKMIIAAAESGEPFRFGSRAENLLRYIEKSDPELGRKYREAAVESAKNIAKNEIIELATRDGVIRKEAEAFGKVARSTDPLATKVAAAVGPDKKLGEIEGRFDELQKRIDATKPAAKELADTAEGVKKFLNEFSNQGVELFRVARPQDDLFQIDTDKGNTANKKEVRLNKAGNVLKGVENNFISEKDPKNPTSAYNNFLLKVQNECTKLEAEMRQCKQEAESLRPAGPPFGPHADPAIEARIQKMSDQVEEMKPHLAELKNVLQDAEKNANDNVNKVKQAKQVLAKAETAHQDEYTHRPRNTNRLS